MNTAMPMASLKPLRKTAPSTASSTSVMATSWSRTNPAANGFSPRCTAASDADRVMVITQEVATKPSRHNTNTLPFQNESRRSSIAIEPWPCGLSRETTRYIGIIPRRVNPTMSRVAMGERVPAATAAMPGM
jgi:hypothetical protein